MTHSESIGARAGGRKAAFLRAVQAFGGEAAAGFLGRQRQRKTGTQIWRRKQLQELRELADEVLKDMKDQSS